MRRLTVSIRVTGTIWALTVALTGATIAQSPSASPAAGSSAIAPVPDASRPPPVALGPVRWKRVTKGKDFTSNPGAYAVGQLPDGRLVVLGTTADATGRPSGAGWVSANGSKWTRLKLKAPDGSAILAIADLGGMSVVSGTDAVGSEAAGGLVWTSADGTAWSAASPVQGSIYSLAAAPGGLVGVGILAGSATAWTSADAVTWTPATLAAQGRAIHVVAGPGGTLVAAGRVGPEEGGSPTVWASVDGGATWSQTILEGLEPGFWSIPAAAPTPIGFVVTVTGRGDGGSISHVWTSPDGLTWTDSLVDQAGSLLAAGSVGTDALVIGHGQVLRSADGITWNPTDETSFDGWQVRDVMTLADGSLFAAGDAFLGQVKSAMATWTGKAEPAP